MWVVSVMIVQWYLEDELFPEIENLSVCRRLEFYVRNVCVLDARYSKVSLGGPIVELSGSLSVFHSFNGMFV